MSGSQLLLIGGRSGVGKSTVAFALHDLLTERKVQHAVVEGDALDLAHPSPWEHRLAERNLAAIWANYRSLGYRRLIYANTISILHADALATAMGDRPTVTSVLLRSSDKTAASRLALRESGESLERHIERSAKAAADLDARTAQRTLKIDTDGQTPSAIARQILDLTDW